jgi:hypothetical protein
MNSRTQRGFRTVKMLYHNGRYQSLHIYPNTKCRTSRVKANINMDFE